MSEHADFARALAAVALADPFALIYSATVVTQHSDGTLDLRLAGSDMEPRRVRLDVGIPGCRVLVDPGTPVKMAFVGGSPDGAFAFGIPLDNNVSRGIVAVGDLGSGGTITAAGVPPGAPILFVYTGPNGVPSPPSPMVSIVTQATTGSTKVLIE